ncbi:hypothetical protein PanWU01x14_330460 [Parasponia andersonii]|uniref:Uncharacterized protein n=1 Tax=Parasponia andersonii TaxID=3476 RepID=A0A2P5AHZ5_PARAD|nr:hypothetical protein PanWU01x14_330460 [Parasponia andersonii]
MATMPSSSSPPSLSSASNSDNSPSKPTPHSPKLQVNAGENDADENKPDLPNNSHDVYLTNHMEKFKKYEADYTRRLMAKYFTKKNLYGGNIFDENITIYDELIKSSRWPCTRSYAEPVKAFEENQRSSNSATITETPSNISNGKHPTKKNG